MRNAVITVLGFVAIIKLSLAESGALCVPPVDGEQDIYLNCSIDTGEPSPVDRIDPLPASTVRYGEEESNQNKNQFTVAEYNIDRNGYGGDGSHEEGINALISLLHDTSVIPEFDVLLLSEVGRGCDAYGGVNGAEEIAKSFGMYWAYSVEVRVGVKGECWRRGRRQGIRV